MPDRPEHVVPPADDFLRKVCYVLMSTLGLAAVGLAALAPALSRYVSDRDILYRQEKHLNALQHLHDQQEALLAQADNPAVTERIAVNHYRYRPSRSIGADTAALGPTWQQLQLAVEHVELPADKQLTPPASLPAEDFLIALAGQPASCNLLILFGGVLVLISLSCFGKQTA